MKIHLPIYSNNQDCVDMSAQEHSNFLHEEHNTLPSVIEGNLNWDDLDCVFADLNECVLLRKIIGRRESGEDLTILSIVEARESFLAKQILKLRVDYQFLNREFTLVLLPSECGARLIRCEYN